MADNSQTIVPLVQTKPAANVETAIYTVPASSRLLLGKIFITNYAAGAEKITLWICLHGAATDLTNAVLFNYSIASGGYLVLEPFVTLSAGDVIRAKTDGDIAIAVIGNVV